MKQIEVTDEMYDFLINISKELNTQDNRATAKPYFFQVQVKEQIAVPEGCGNEAWHYDGSLIETDEEINQAIAEYKEIDVSEVQEMDEYEKEEILEKAGYNKVNYDYKHNYENCFLTEKACEKHIEINRHNYKNPHSYLNHAYRNSEMEKLFEFLGGLAKNV